MVAPRTARINTLQRATLAIQMVTPALQRAVLVSQIDTLQRATLAIQMVTTALQRALLAIQMAVLIIQMAVLDIQNAVGVGLDLVGFCHGRLS